MTLCPVLWQLSNAFSIILRSRTKKGHITLHDCGVLYFNHDLLPFTITSLKQQANCHYDDQRICPRLWEVITVMLLLYVI